jgi:hypothetical protein
MGHGTTHGHALGRPKIYGDEGRLNLRIKATAVLTQTSSTGGYAILVTA